MGTSRTRRSSFQVNTSGTRTSMCATHGTQTKVVYSRPPHTATTSTREGPSTTASDAVMTHHKTPRTTTRMPRLRYRRRPRRTRTRRSKQRQLAIDRRFRGARCAPKIAAPNHQRTVTKRARHISSRAVIRFRANSDFANSAEFAK